MASPISVRRAKKCPPRKDLNRESPITGDNVGGWTMVFIFALFLVLVESRRPRPPLRASTWRGCVGTSIDAPVVTAEQRGIYVLQLEGDRIYVGKSMSNVTARVLEHFTTGGSAWTKKYQPLVQIDPITNATEDLESWERAETLERMWQHGIDNVRGWGYTSTDGISEFERESIFRQLIERKDLCRKCGREGHMMAQCAYRDVAPWVGSGLLPKREAILFEGDSRRVNTARELTKMMKAGGDLPLPLLPLQPPEPGQKAGKPQKKRANGPQPKIAFDEQRPDERQLQQLQQQQQQMQADQQQKTPPPPPPSPQPQKAKKKAEKPLPKVPSAPPTVPRPAAGAGPVAVPVRTAGDPLRPRPPPAAGPKGTNDTAVSVTPARRGGGATGAFLKVSVASFVMNAWYAPFCLLSSPACLHTTDNSPVSNPSIPPVFSASPSRTHRCRWPVPAGRPVPTSPRHCTTSSSRRRWSPRRCCTSSGSPGG